MNQQILRALSMGVVVATIAGHVMAVGAAESRAGLLDDTFTASLGTFLLDTTTKVKLNGGLGTEGTEVNFGRDLGFRDSDRFRLDATWRFAERHKLRSMYFSTSQSASKALERSITIRDTVYPVAASVSASSSAKILELAYEYVFMRRETYELAGSAGIHALKFSFGVSGTGSVGGQAGQFRTESASTTAPLPVFGLRGLWEFSPQWYLDGQAQYFALKIDNIDGRVTDLRIGVTRMFGSHFGIGAGWNQFRTKVGLDKDRFDGDVNWRYSGAQLYLTASF